MWGCSTRAAICKGEEGPHQEPHVGTVILDFPPPDWVIKLCCLGHLILGVLLQQPKLTKTQTLMPDTSTMTCADFQGNVHLLGMVSQYITGYPVVVATRLRGGFLAACSFGRGQATDLSKVQECPMFLWYGGAAGLAEGSLCNLLFAMQAHWHLIIIPLSFPLVQLSPSGFPLTNFFWASVWATSTDQKNYQEGRPRHLPSPLHTPAPRIHCQQCVCLGSFPALAILSWPVTWLSVGPLASLTLPPRGLTGPWEETPGSLPRQGSDYSCNNAVSHSHQHGGVVALFLSVFQHSNLLGCDVKDMSEGHDSWFLSFWSTHGH